MPQARAPRGRQREDDLIEAGVALLAETGWSGVTHRAVAARAAANAGLVHYYFGGTPGLRRAVARRAAHRCIGAVVDAVLEAPTLDEAVTVATTALEAARTDHVDGRLTTELASAAFDDAEVRDVVRLEFAQARARLADRLHAGQSSWSRGRAEAMATLLVAAADGLALQLLLDPDLPAADVVGVARALAHAADDDGRNRE